ncbi:glycosyltransferase [Gordonia spumicola]|uniref:glycosyltransferase n=1 Tax=Gordonia spumicola TaxID=589161 RepID=UPI001E34D004|nr:glycosyltransferase [Gordonia spumicola]
MPTISAVVPMFNEHDRIESCIRALLDQTRPLDEIIIVDNGSTDGSADVVAALAADEPTIRMISESVPGCYAARASGYDAAVSDVIARTDADCRVARDWAERIEEFFGGEVGAEYAAVTGIVTLYDAPPFEFVDRRARSVPDRFANGGQVDGLHGLNHAIRRTAWIAVRDDLTRRQDIWEDLDIAMALGETGERVYFEPRLEVASSVRALRKSPFANRHYVTGGIRTARARGDRRRTRVMYLDVLFRTVGFTGMWLVFRPWDERTKTWKLRRLLQPLDDARWDVTQER